MHPCTGSTASLAAVMIVAALVATAQSAKLPAPRARFLACVGEADPAAVVRHGGATFTVLTPSLVRMQAPPYDDRCTFAVTNRKLGQGVTPAFNKTVLANGTLVIETDALIVRLDPSQAAVAPRGGARRGGDAETTGGETCPSNATKLSGTDAVGATQIGDGRLSGVKGASECCSRCFQAPTCTAYVFAPDVPDPAGFNCWLLARDKVRSGQGRRGVSG